MRAKRSFLALLFVLMIMLSVLMIPTGAANENATLKLTPIEALPGEEFTTTLYVTDGSEIADFDVELVYDTDVVELVSAKENKDVDGAVTVNTKNVGIINVNYSNVENTYEDMPILDLTFKVDENAGPNSTAFLKRSPKDTNVATRLDGNDYLDVPIICDFDNLSIYSRGDIDLNGKVEIRDVTHLRRYLARLETLTDYQLLMGDAYYDNSVNVRDAVYIQQYLARFEVLLGDRANIYFYDADGNLYSTKSVIRGGSISKIPLVPERTGYSDGTWSTSKTSAVEPDLNNITEDITLYAFYNEAPIMGEDEYPIVYHLYDNDPYLQKAGVNNPNPDKYNSKDGLQLQDPTVSGYTFEGWYDGAGSNAVQIKSIPKGTTGTINLYAHWSASSNDIIYECDMGNIPTGKYSVNTGATLIVPTKDLVPEMANYIFMGWTDEDGNVVKSIPAGTTGTIRVTANWTSRRNLARPKELENPIICEDTENGTILFAYELGTLENVPLYEIKSFNAVDGLKVVTSETKTSSLSTTDAKTIAKSVAKATTNSQAWTLAENWNNTSSVTESYANQHGYTVEEANTLAKTSSNTFSLSNNTGGSASVSKNSSASAKLTGSNSHYDSSVTDKGWEINADINTKTSIGASAIIPAGAIPVKVDAGYEVNTDLNGGYHQNTTDTNINAWDRSYEVNSSKSKSVNQSAYWNTDKSFSSSNSISSSHTVSKALQEIISETKEYGTTYSTGGNRSEDRAFATTDSSTDEYASTLTYFDSDVVTESTTYETNGSNVGKYRIVCAGKVHVFGVVGYDVATNTYYTYTYNVMDDNTTSFLDYSYDGTFEDYDNAALPFEIPYEVHEFVTSRVLATEGLQVDDTTGKITDYYGDSTAVFVPSYISVDNNDGTRKSVKVTGISKDAFKGKNIESIALSKFITEIPDSAFEDCSSLYIINCPGVTSIGKNAFKGCNELHELDLSSAVTSIGENAFENVPKVTVRAANTDVANAVAQSKAKDITLNISEIADTIAGTILTVPEVTDTFTLQGEGKNYSNLKLNSDAGTTIINRVKFIECSGMPIQISSDNLQLHSMSVDSKGVAMLLKSEETNLGLYGQSNISSANGKAIVCRDTNLAAISQSITPKLNVTGDILIWGELTGSNYISGGTVKEIDEQEYSKYLNGIYTVTFDANGGSVSVTNKTVYSGDPIDEIPTPTRDNCSFEGWYKEDGTRVTEETVMDISNDITLKAHWKSGWILETDLPSDGTVQDSKWTYTLTTRTTSNSSTAPAGYTQYKDPTWVWGSYGAWSGWSRNSVSSSDSRKVETRTVTDSAAYTNYKYYIYRTSDGYGFGTKNYYTGSAHGSCTIYDEINLSYTLPVYDSSLGLYGPYNSSMFSHAGDSYWFYSGSNYVPAVTHTEWRYADRSKVYTYYYQKVEQKESATEVTASDTVSNVQKWVQYVVE